MGVLTLCCEPTESAVSDQGVDDFIQGCTSFMERYPDQSVGICSEFGFNRAGYCICCFLVEHLGWGVDAAVMAFAKARPPGIFDAATLKSLWSRYDEDEEDIPVVAPPRWWAQQD